MLVSADVSMINNKDEEGWTALHFAAINGCLECKVYIWKVSYVNI